jgi:hypothetical protein
MFYNRNAFDFVPARRGLLAVTGDPGSDMVNFVLRAAGPAK